MTETKTVLIVDDDALIRQSLRAVLTSEGFAVSCCDNGPSALDLSRRKCFGVIITDYHMDGMNGADVTKELRALCPGSLIIGMSGEHKERDFFEAGVDAFCSKPLSPVKLVSLLQRRLLR